jgi:hypothetical protein
VRLDDFDRRFNGLTQALDERGNLRLLAGDRLLKLPYLLLEDGDLPLLVVLTGGRDHRWG